MFQVVLKKNFKKKKNVPITYLYFYKNYLIYILKIIDYIVFILMHYIILLNNIINKNIITILKILDTIPRSEFCFDLVNTVMDEAIGRYYVEKYYSPTKKQYAEKVVEYIKQSMINRIPEVDWLDDDTIEYAYKKVAKMTEIIGYQDYIMNPEKLYEKYEKIGINENDFFNNMINYYSYINGENLKYINFTINELNTDIPPQVNNIYMFFYIIVNYF